jgi:glycosyltransferase involved in cell wall biosynthesis
LPRVYFAVPGDIEARTGGSVYDRKVIDALREDGWRVELLSWPASFPFPSEACRDEVEDSLAAVPDDSLVMIDGLALGVLSGLARREAQRLRLVGLVHHPLALETGLAPNIAAEFAASERDALACCRAVIVTSETTAAIVEAAFGVPGELITVATPGVDKPRVEDRFVHGAERRPGPVRIFSMGSITPRKAHDVLVAALSLIEDLDWTCVIAGGLERDPETAQDLVQQIADLGLGDRVALVGEISETEAAALYADADIFALASVYEGYGMVFAEALAFGLPIVATTGGAIPEVVSEEAGILAMPGDAQAFAEALREIVSDPARRAALAEGSRAAGAYLTGWDRTAATIAARLDQL